MKMLFGKSSNWIEVEPLAADDLPFQHYSLQHRAVAWISRYLFDRVTYTVRHGLIRGMKRRGGLGWMPWCIKTKEEMFWQEFPLGGLAIYDLGAFHGILTLFYASRSAQVIAYEPNELNFGRLVENIRLNNLTNVQVRKLGVGAQPSVSTLFYDRAMAGGGTLNTGATGPLSQQVEVTTLDRDIARFALPAPDLIKIDIEGWELEALKGARETLAARHPALFLEMHGDTLREKQRKIGEIVEFLRDAGYQSILHIESGAEVVPGNEAVAREGHLYCQYTASRSTECPTNTLPFPPKAHSA